MQTGELNDPVYFLGATYHPGLAREALDHGTFLTGALALTAATHMADLNPQWFELSSAISEAMMIAIEQVPLRARHKTVDDRRLGYRSGSTSVKGRRLIAGPPRFA